MVDNIYLDEIEKRNKELGAPPLNKFFDGNDIEKWNGEAERQANLYPPGTTKQVNAKVQNFLLENPEYKIVLDVGCGTGLLSYSVPSDRVYIGADQNKRMLHFAKQRRPDARLIDSAITEIDIKASDLVSKVDVIITCTVLQHNHFRTSSVALQSFSRLLQPNGRLLLIEGTLNPSTYTEEVIKKYKHPRIDFETEIGAVSGGYFTINGWVKFLEAHDFTVLDYDVKNTMFTVKKNA